jgi:hypothetical protein
LALASISLPGVCHAGSVFGDCPQVWITEDPVLPRSDKRRSQCSAEHLLVTFTGPGRFTLGAAPAPQ